jgi:carbonic anhydrase
MDKILQELLDNNRDWVENRLSEDKSFFEDLAKGQKPPVLWIGCSDSRVSANVITGTGPGELFLQSNIANVIVHDDFNMLSVLEYAVNHLKVKHIIICGHYGCGGVQAAMSNKDFGLINKWIRYVKDVYAKHKVELESIEDEDKRFDRMVELNVEEQLSSLAETSIVQKAWKEKDRNLEVHGWVFDLRTGKLKDLGKSMSDNSKIENIYRFE